jgi:hypothetical protein
MNAPSGIRTRATTLKGWRPRPLVDGGGRPRIAATPCLHWPGGPVAQLVEQGTFNPKVTGSIPVRPTFRNPLDPDSPRLPYGFHRAATAPGKSLSSVRQTVTANGTRGSSEGLQRHSSELRISSAKLTTTRRPVARR